MRRLSDHDCNGALGKVYSREAFGQLFGKSVFANLEDICIGPKAYVECLGVMEICKVSYIFNRNSE